MSFNDNKQFWQEFVELYQAYPCLWIVKIKEYLNKHLKDEAMLVLVEKCKSVFPNANKEFVTKKIKSLRASFRRELRKVTNSKSTGSGRDDIYEPSLWYYDLLLFTADCEVVREEKTTLTHRGDTSEGEEENYSLKALKSVLMLLCSVWSIVNKLWSMLLNMLRNISPTGKYLSLYSLERGGLKTISKYVPKSTEKIINISWCHDNSYIAILQENENPEIVSSKDPSNLILVHTISSVPEVTSIRFKNNTKRILALGNSNGELMLYDTKNRCVSKRLGKLPTEITLMSFTSANELAVTSHKTLAVFNLSNAEKIEIKNPEVCTALKCFNKNSVQVAVGCANGTVIIWDIVREKELKTYQMHSAAVTGIALSKSDKLLVTCGGDNKICVIDTVAQECVFRKNLHQPLKSIDISADNQHMIAGLEDGSIYVYNMADHLKPQICSKMHQSAVNQMAFINGLGLEMLENDSIGGEDSYVVENIMSKQEKDFSTETEEQSSGNIIEEPKQDHLIDEESFEVTEEKVKLDLIKLINNNFNYLEDQLVDHCGRLQALISNELDSLYSVAARWECFKTMEMEEIVRYICGIISASSETKILSQKSDHTNMQHE